jgi:hypothetical protein
MVKIIGTYLDSYFMISISFSRQNKPGSSAIIFTGYYFMTEIRIPVEVEMFVITTTESRPVQGFIKPPVYWVLRASFCRIKRPEREADHLHLLQKAWSFTSNLLQVFMAWCLWTNCFYYQLTLARRRNVRVVSLKQAIATFEFVVDQLWNTSTEPKLPFWIK